MLHCRSLACKAWLGQVCPPKSSVSSTWSPRRSSRTRRSMKTSWRTSERSVASMVRSGHSRFPDLCLGWMFLGLARYGYHHIVFIHHHIHYRCLLSFVLTVTVKRPSTHCQEEDSATEQLSPAILIQTSTTGENSRQQSDHTDTDWNHLNLHIINSFSFTSNILIVIVLCLREGDRKL